MKDNTYEFEESKELMSLFHHGMETDEKVAVMIHILDSCYKSHPHYGFVFYTKGTMTNHRSVSEEMDVIVKRHNESTLKHIGDEPCQLVIDRNTDDTYYFNSEIYHGDDIDEKGMCIKQDDPFLLSLLANMVENEAYSHYGQFIPLY